MVTWPLLHNTQEAGVRLEVGSRPAHGACLPLLTWSRYWGSTSARTRSVLLLISEGFSTTQFPAGRGGAGRELREE